MLPRATRWTKGCSTLSIAIGSSRDDIEVHDHYAQMRASVVTNSSRWSERCWWVIPESDTTFRGSSSDCRPTHKHRSRRDSRSRWTQ